MTLRLTQTLSKVGVNGFLLGLFIAIALAYLFPELGTVHSGLPWKPVINVGIGFVFFFYGVKLDPIQLRKGLSNWRLHLLIQGCTFLFFPVLVFLLNWFNPWMEEEFILGVSYLSALPSTVSASVVMVSIAGGNLPAAIFNASVSSLLGVVFTPAWIGVLSDRESGEIDFWSSLGDLSQKVLLPVFLGILSHKWLYPKLKNFLPKLKFVDQSVIMMIVFTSFSESFAGKIFHSYSILSLLGLAFGMLSIFLGALILIYFVSSWLSFSRQDKITASFCGSNKSLVHGVVIGKVIFPDPLVLGLVLLPVMLYHIQQLIFGSMLAGYFGKKNIRVSA